MQNNSKLRTVFVSGLSYSTTEEELKNFFSTCGQIELIKLPKYKGTERNIGYAHITFAEVTIRNNALCQSGKFLNGRYLDIQPAKGPQNLPKYIEIEDIKEDGIFVKNLPYKCSKQNIVEFFSSCGTIKDTEMISPSSKFLGYCYISFENAGAIQKALLLSGHPMNDRFLKIDIMSYKVFEKVKQDILTKREAKKILKTKKSKNGDRKVTSDPIIPKYHSINNQNLKNANKKYNCSPNACIPQKRESDDYGNGLTSEMQLKHGHPSYMPSMHPVANQGNKTEEFSSLDYRLNPPPGLTPMQNPYLMDNHLSQNPQIMSQSIGYNNEMNFMQKRKPDENNSNHNFKRSNQSYQSPKFLSDHRYKQQRTPVQSAIDYLKINSQSCNEVNNYRQEDLQNKSFFGNHSQEISQFDAYQMHQANQNYLNQVHDYNFHSSPAYGYYDSGFENTAPYQIPSSNQYCGNGNMPNNQVYPSHYQQNSYNGSGSSYDQHNTPLAYNYENSNSSNESLGMQKIHFPEFSEDQSNEDSNDDLLLLNLYSRNSLKKENCSKDSDLTSYIQEPIASYGQEPTASYVQKPMTSYIQEHIVESNHNSTQKLINQKRNLNPSQFPRSSRQLNQCLFLPNDPRIANAPYEKLFRNCETAREADFA